MPFNPFLNNDRSLEVITTDFATDVAVGDGKGYLTVPAELDGYNIIGAHVRNITAGVTGTFTVQIANVTKSYDDIFSPKITVDTGETGSDTAATPAVVDATKDDVSAYDLLRVDYDGIHSGTAAQGAIVTIRLRKP